MNPAKSQERKEAVQKAKTQYNNEFGSMDLVKSYKSLFELLWYSQLPCFDVRNITSTYKDEMSLIKKCYWKEKQIDCTSIFFTRPTDRGMCCTFNMQKAEDIFEESQYATMLSKLQKQDGQNSFEDYLQPDWYVDSKEPKSHPGHDRGLRLVLDAHTDRVSSGTISDNFRGFITVVDGGDRYPLTTRNSFLVRPGKENYVSINAIVVEAEQGVRKINATKRDCYFSDENPLEMHKQYSQSNCLLECFIKFARNNMSVNIGADKCTPWFYPVTDEYVTDMCDPWETTEFQKWMTSVPDQQCVHCLTDCEGTIYRTRMSSAPFMPCDHTNLGVNGLCDLNNEELQPPIWKELVMAEYNDSLGRVPSYISSIASNIRQYVPSPEKRSYLTFKDENLVNPKYEAFNKDIAIVKFYFDKSSTLQYMRYERLTMTGYISQIGGLLGLAMGFSFVSAAEIFYWVTVRLFRNILSYDQANSRKMKSRSRKVVSEAAFQTAKRDADEHPSSPEIGSGWVQGK